MFDTPRPSDGGDYFGPFGYFEDNGKTTEFCFTFIISVWNLGTIIISVWNLGTIRFITESNENIHYRMATMKISEMFFDVSSLPIFGMSGTS